MKIVIVAPTPVPFVVGGAERLWWGLQEYINKHTLHQCELIKIPTKEDSFWDLIISYHAFYKLDVSYFDMVITTKYPAWMIQHPNHHIYMQHCLRGLYDTYHLTGLPNDLLSEHPGIKNILASLEREESSIEHIFQQLFTLKDDPTVPKESYAFPGPFIRKIVHFFDKKAMEDIKSFSAISETVIKRKEYFPKEVSVHKIYHPSNLSDYHNEAYDYFFAVSRLDEAKRIEMIVEAYMQVDTDIPLKIAGTGPLSKKLHALTKDDKRVAWLGFVSDEALLIHYAKAYAVLFVPYDEDYGLITIEAMMSEKPVLTFDDTGGVLEFIEEKVTGLICEPDVDALVNTIRFISNNSTLCKKMGKAAKERVKEITWKSTVDTLLHLSSKDLLSVQNRKKKITVVTTYPVYPPRGGGQSRIFYLYRELAKHMDVDIVSLVSEKETYTKREIASNLFEIRVPKSKEHADKEKVIEEKAGISVTDIAMLYLYAETPLFIDMIKASCKDSSMVITSHPYTYPLLKDSVDIPIVYESHNVEHTLKKQMLEDTPHNRGLLKSLFKVEKSACLASVFTTICSDDDAMTFETLYGYDKKKAVVVPNGVDIKSVLYVSKERRKRLQSELGLSKKKIVLFIGSSHQPNRDAVKEIFHIAKSLPYYHFIIMGSVSDYFTNDRRADNIGFTGSIDDDEKEIYLSIADIAINPMLTGSGTNLKMLDYMASGIPVISSNVGVRGLDVTEQYVLIDTIDRFPEAIQNGTDAIMVDKARTYVEENFSWEVIATSYRSKILDWIEHKYEV